MNSLLAPDVTSAAFKADPFPFYARLRAEAPVYPVDLTTPFKRRAWLVTRYDDVLFVLKDARFAKDRHNAMPSEQLRTAPRIPPLFKALQRNLLGLDNPDHARLRSLVHKAFTPRLIEGMHDQIQTVADQLLDNARQNGAGMDLIADYALPLPLTLIGTILGVPARDNSKFHRWTRTLISAGTNRNPLVLVPSLLAFMSYMKRLIRERSVRPQEDLISALAQAKEDSDRMSEDEVLAMIFLLLSAGHETTVNLIASGVLALLEHPAEWRKLQEDPLLIRSAVEELLRFVCPVEMATERYAREDVLVAGTTIPRGALTLAVIGSANRDAAHFDAPDTLDIRRENNRHLAFGHGIHYCLGAALARLEGEVAINTLVRRMPHLRLSVAPDQLRWHGGFIVRGLETLPVTL